MMQELIHDIVGTVHTKLWSLKQHYAQETITHNAGIYLAPLAKPV